MKMNKMNLLVLLCLFFINFSAFISGQSEAEVKYYMDLITREIAATRDHEIIENANEFKPFSERVREYPEKFDYIVVGAGAAGAVVAARLSESSKNKVLLLEAGGDENDFSDIPAVSYYLYASNFTWNFFTTPQKNACLGMKGKRCTYPRGKGLGGSSIINSLNYVRGNKEDYDSWFRQGNPGWSWDDVFPLFLKSENASFNYYDPRYHRSGGPVTVEYERPQDAQYEAYIEANLEQRRDFIDYNGKTMVGVGKTQFTTINGRRVSTNKAYLKPAKNRKNLKILTHSYVVKVNIQKGANKATGVTFSNGKQLFSVNARKEVIISAGAFQSPQILMLSGIGLSSDLSKHGIKTIQSLSVGYNLQEHNGYLALLFETNATTQVKGLREDVREYLNGYGPLTFAVNSKAIAWFDSKYQSLPNYPDIEIIIVTPNNTGSITQLFNNYDNETYNAIWRDVDPTRSFTTSLLLMHPKSRGTVKLRSADPYDYPLIDNKFYSDPNNEDMEIMYEGIQKALNLVNSKAFRKINARLRPTTHPKCRNFKEFSKPYWFCQLKYLTIPFYHPVGTCKMGPNPLKGAVVDHQLRVHGIKNLRVADTSIMPTQMTGHTYAPAIMIGEKAAELIMRKK